jgi:hypothetical protein
MGPEKAEKEDQMDLYGDGRKLQKIKYILLLILIVIYGLGFTERFSGSSHGKYFPCSIQKNTR